MSSLHTSLLCACVAIFAGCRSAPAASSRGRGADAGWPALEGVATTDGTLAVANLDSSISALERALRERPPARAPELIEGLAQLLQLRAQSLATIADYDRVEELAEQLVALRPADGRSWLLRANARSALHRFPAALADVARAERLGADPERAFGLRASIFQATGRLDEALVLRQRASAAHPGIITLGLEATVRAALGENAEAERLFEKALRSYRDVSPFPVAWLCFQSGVALEREGRIAEAMGRYRVALARLPQHAEAASNLAALEMQVGHRDRAVALLRPLVDAGDPEYTAQLAQLLRASGDDQASALERRARSRYELLLAAHPEAFADHAARAFLASDPWRSLALAQTNLAVRRTWEAYDLALTAALAAGDRASACRFAKEVTARPSPPAPIRSLAALAGC